MFTKSYSQRPSDKTDFFVKNPDSVTIATVFYADNESTPSPKIVRRQEPKKDSITGKWTLPYVEYEDVKDTVYTINQKELSQAEIKKLISLLKKPKLEHALLYHYDIQLDFYKNGKIIQTATISSYTKNLEVIKNGCKLCMDKNGEEINPCFFQGMVSNELKEYIVKLLKLKGLWNNEQQFFEDM